MAGSWWSQHWWVGSENEGSWERTSQRKEAIRISRAHLQHQKPCYSLKLFHKGKAIHRKLDENCLKEGHADPSLIARWKTHSPENVRCLRCIRMLGCRLWKKWHLPGSPKPAGNCRITECVPSGCSLIRTRAAHWLCLSESDVLWGPQDLPRVLWTLSPPWSSPRPFPTHTSAPSSSGGLLMPQNQIQNFRAIATLISIPFERQKDIPIPYTHDFFLSPNSMSWT